MRVSEYMARFGGEVEVSVFGKIYRVTVPDNTKEGSLLRIHGKGTRDVKSGESGDLYCKVVIGGKDIEDESRMKKKKSPWLLWMVVVLIVLGLVAIGLYFTGNLPFGK
jgi:DnaJ-class molecular chaperone